MGGGTMKLSSIRDIFFGKVKSAVAPFLNNSSWFVDPALSGIRFIARYYDNPRIFIPNVHPGTLLNCTKITINSVE
jgi:hypothetical protein